MSEQARARGWTGFYRRLWQRRATEPGGFDFRLVTLAMLLTVVCTMPLWLVSALSVQMRAELDFSIVALGGAVAVQRMGGAVLAWPLGRLADRVGPTGAMRTAAGLAAISALGIAAVARGYLVLTLFLLISGASNALGQTAANLALVRAVPGNRQGVAFGIKQSALPVGSLLAGLAVPLIGLTIGWRWAFVLATALSLVVVIMVPRKGLERYAKPSGVRNRVQRRRPLLVLAIGLFFGMGAAMALTTYTVESATAAGVGAAAAGLLLTLGSAASIATRLYAGYRADKRGGAHLVTVARMQFTGAVGILLIATQIPSLLLVGTLIAFALAWGFNGVFWFAIVRLSPATPAAASGLVMPGGMLGGVVGPIVFGLIADQAGFQTAWYVAASWSVIAGSLMLVGRRLLRASLDPAGSSPPPSQDPAEEPS